MSGFSGVSDTDREIMQRLNIRDIESFSRTNRHLYKVSKHVLLWKHLVEKDFSTKVAQHKPKNHTFEEQYKYLMNVSVDQAAAEGRMDGLLVLNEPPSELGLIEAVKNGHLNVLKWAKKTHDTLPLEQSANIAAKYGHLRILKWLHKNEIYANVKGANAAAYSGNYEILEWLHENGIYANEEGANFAVSNNDVPMLKWLYKHNIMPDYHGVEVARVLKRDKVIDWLKEEELIQEESSSESSSESYEYNSSESYGTFNIHDIIDEYDDEYDDYEWTFFNRRYDSDDML